MIVFYLVDWIFRTKGWSDFTKRVGEGHRFTTVCQKCEVEGTVNPNFEAMQPCKNC